MNFHGTLVWLKSTPTAESLDGNYEAIFDVQSCPELALTLPRRDRPVENAFLDELIEAGRRTIWEYMAAAGIEPTYETWAAADAVGVRIATPRIRLRQWPVGTPDDPLARQVSDKASTADGGNVIVIGLKNSTGKKAGTSLAKEMLKSAVEHGELPAELGDVDFRMADPRLAGFTDYERIQQVKRADVVYRTKAGDERTNLEPWPSRGEKPQPRASAATQGLPAPTVAERVAAITLKLHTEITEPTGETVKGQIDVGCRWTVIRDDPGLPDTEPEAHDILVTEDTGSLPPNKLAEMLTEAFWTPNEDAAYDEDQERAEYHTRMNDCALAVLTSDDERRRAMLADAIAEAAWPYAPANRATLVRITRTKTGGTKAEVTFEAANG